MQLWEAASLVILISMTFEIPFSALSLAVLLYGIQSAFYTKFVAILFVVAHGAGDRQPVFDHTKWSYGEPLIRLDHRRTDPDGLYVF